MVEDAWDANSWIDKIFLRNSYSTTFYPHRFEEQIYKNYYYEYGSAVSRLRLEKWNRILGIISILTSIKLYYQKASVRTDAGQMLFFQYCVVLKP